MGVLTINGVDIGKLVSMSYALTRIESDESVMDLNGRTNVDYIAEKVKLVCDCILLTQVQASAILNSFDVKVYGGGDCTVTYPDAKLGSNRTANFKVTNISSPTVLMVGAITRWEGLSFTLEEL
jgi:hypothetical protein